MWPRHGGYFAALRENNRLSLEITPSFVFSPRERLRLNEEPVYNHYEHSILIYWAQQRPESTFHRRCNWRVVTLSILRLSQQRWCRVHPVLFTSKNTSRLASRNRGQPAVFIYVQKKHTITSLPPADGNRRCERPRSRKLGHVERKRSPFSRFVEKQTRRRFWQSGEYPASAHVKLIHTIAIGAESDVLCMVPEERVAFLRCMGSTSRLFF